MSDGERSSEGARASLRRRLRLQLEQLQPPLQCFAENVLAEGSRIDLVTRDPLGGVTLVLIGDPGEDLELFTRSLAHCRWVEQRIPDWLQLAPELQLSQKVCALLVCPDFRTETLAAAQSLSPRVELTVFRELPDGSGLLLLEPLLMAPFDAAASQFPEEGVENSPGRQPVAAPPRPGRLEEAAKPQARQTRPSEFRSGLSEDDLQLTAEEVREFE